MNNIKEKFLRFLQSVINILIIVSSITFILSGVMTAFYTELNTFFSTLGWTQERFAWMTVSSGSLGTIALISTRLSGTLKQAIVLTRQQNAYDLKLSQKMYDEKFETQRKINEKLRNQMQLYNDVNIKEMKKMKEVIDEFNEFNKIQAEKYIKAPDTLIDLEMKEKYKDFLNKNKKV